MIHALLCVIYDTIIFVYPRQIYVLSIYYFPKSVYYLTVKMALTLKIEDIRLVSTLLLPKQSRWLAVPTCSCFSLQPEMLYQVPTDLTACANQIWLQPSYSAQRVSHACVLVIKSRTRCHMLRPDHLV